MLDADLDNFESVLSTAEAQGSGPLFLLFLANRDPAIGHSWCPDCVRAEPVIYKTLDNSNKQTTLLRAYVGDRPTWRNPAHPWRLDKRFGLKGVPTLIRQRKKKMKGERGGILKD
ncbi:hypothetical protein KP509_23G067900 [Ceratopteris richardii]|uniref:Thioredoxin domain-containing protein n=1 Tax=Ceratopteris richardii TaxID=49495 RepID=A0A8T2S3D7_CERRI|nr:hypothetical protein KP509_23G067900 [Ceratopteris richardii]